MLKTACAFLALTLSLALSLESSALAGSCASPAEATALKTAVIQQELMVAAFQCHETSAYNRFVINYRGELQASDAALKSYFVRRGGEAGYDSFKTKAANVFGLEQARHGDAFCAKAHALYAEAFANRDGLTRFVDSQIPGSGKVCAEPRAILSAATLAAPSRARVIMAEARPADQDGDYAVAPREEAPPQRYGRDYGYAPPPPPPAAPFRFGWGRW